TETGADAGPGERDQNQRQYPADHEHHARVGSGFLEQEQQGGEENEDQGGGLGKLANFANRIVTDAGIETQESISGGEQQKAGREAPIERKIVVTLESVARRGRAGPRRRAPSGRQRHTPQ